MKKTFLTLMVLLFVTISGTPLLGQGYIFSDVVRNPATSVKNQAISGTCWSYATAAFLEAELLRTGKGEFDLSEMYIVHINYLNRINDNYLRRGKGNLGEGSLAHMFTNIVDQYGIVPQEVYNGIQYKSEFNNHNELNKFVNAISGAAVELKRKSPEYTKLINSLLDIYLGPLPETFYYKGKEYSPKSFAQNLKLNMSDYVELTSFSHIPFYKASVIEVPDNWDFARFYNLPLDEFIEVINYALLNGYTVAWDGDVSERSFSHKNGVAINPDLASEDEYKEALKFEKLYPEVNVTQEIRQKNYESFTTTDDHLMLLTGIAKDQNGTKYYITKNSWGPESNKSGGYLNMSESFVREKSISVMVNKNSIPKEIRQKLGL
ncbi:MAG: C1 family peptidase [Bacteroidales bacterium]